MRSADIRKKFIAFFEAHGHVRLPSSSLVPTEDTTVLLTTAGMQQIMPFFLGLKEPPTRRITTIQKSFRTNDIDEVGDVHHHTFFEMLGNFSVGDYFKKEAVEFAFEFLTQHLSLSLKKLWITIHPSEDVADKAWQQQGIPASKILVDETNFWGPPGETGPCGPDSEIYYDFGKEVGCGKEDCSPLCSCGRFLEIWNLVFMEFFQDKEGKRTKLPSQNIDTGMGLERITRVLQGKISAYETDLFASILKRICEVEGLESKQENAKNLRIIADHARAAVFLAGDGVTPSNLGRGYVMRRIIRRAVRSGYLLKASGEKMPFLDPILDEIITVYNEQYPALLRKKTEIKNIILEEEKKFFTTLEKGIHLLKNLIEKFSSQRIIPGTEVFQLYDTYGFPLELTREIVQESNFKVDEKGFEKAMNEQKERSRRGSQFSVQLDTKVYQELLTKHSETKFIGYDRLESSAKVLAIIADKKEIARAQKGLEIEVVLDQTPFYARAGGQVGDSGRLLSDLGKVEITDTRSAGGLIVHLGTVVDGEIQKHQTIEAIVDQEIRTKTACHHTATHILHQAMREILGTSVKQAGSSVNSKRLRFDFTFPRKLTDEELSKIETLANEKIKQKLPVTITTTTLDKAKEQGVIALFDGKYEQIVRVVQVGTWSRELCGGTHVKNTSCLLGIKITKQESVAGGMRRIRASVIII